MDTIQKVLENAASGEDFYLLLGDFLDEFYHADKEIRQKMIENRPNGMAMQNKSEYLSFAASTAHKLANDYKLDVPSWVFEKTYYLTDTPFFGCQARGNLRLLFMYTSPAEFKHRNLFVDENVLKRV
jgi:hypothetical protein